MGHGPRLARRVASTASGSTSSTPSSRTRTSATTRSIEGTSPWSRLEHRHDLDHADFARADRPVPGDPRRGRGPDVGRRAVLRRDRDRGGVHRRPSHRLRLVADGIALDRGRVRRPASTSARRPTARTAGRRSRSRTTTASARRPACRRRSAATASRTTTRSPRPPPSSSWPSAARRSCTTARRSGCSTSTSRGTRSSTRRRSGPDPTSRGTTARAAGRRCSGGRVRAPGSRPAGRGSGSAPDAERAERRAPGRQIPDSVLAAYRRLLAFRRTAPALRTGAMERLANPDPDVLAWTRTGDGQRLLVVVSFVGRAADRRRRRRSPAARWQPRVGTHRDPAGPGRRRAARPAAGRGGHPRGAPPPDRSTPGRLPGAPAGNGGRVARTYPDRGRDAAATMARSGPDQREPSSCRSIS